jgi:uncharacterized protein (DUF1501 family)
MKVSRRNFLKSGASGMALFSSMATVPLWVSKSAHAIAKNLDKDRKLVLVQLSGGNDGLNSVIPYEDDLYNGDVLRPNLRITSGLENTVLDSLNALHPRLSRLAQWYRDGHMAVLQNIGYPNPNLSHFVSTDFWERGNSPGAALSTTQGWISRFWDNPCAGMPADQIDPLGMLVAGQPYVAPVLDGSTVYRPPAVASFSSYQMLAPNNAAGALRLAMIDAVNATQTLDADIDFLQRAAFMAQASLEDIALASQAPTLRAYPDDRLGRALDMVSRVIRSGFDTPIFYVGQGGYDTHANQWGTDPATTGDHPALLDVLDGSLDAFLQDMRDAGLLDKVLVLTFSEFGRRAAENGSNGTDHGAASALFALGGGVHGGIYGGQPDLADLDADGNLRHKVDFRAVYARVLDDWLNVDPEPIFGSADFNSPAFNIQAGMGLIPFLGGGLLDGDVDGDGRVTAMDIQQVVNAALGRGTPYKTDLTGDRRTDAADIQRVVNRVLGRA